MRNKFLIMLNAWRNNSQIVSKFREAKSELNRSHDSFPPLSSSNEESSSGSNSPVSLKSSLGDNSSLVILRPVTPPLKGQYITFIPMRSFNPCQMELDMINMEMIEIAKKFNTDNIFANYISKQNSLDYLSERFRLAHVRIFSDLLKSYEFRNNLAEGTLYRDPKDGLRWAVIDNNYVNFQIEENAQKKTSVAADYQTLLATLVEKHRYETINKLMFHYLINMALKSKCINNQKLCEAAIRGGDDTLISWSFHFAHETKNKLLSKQLLQVALDKNNKNLIKYMTL